MKEKKYGALRVIGNVYKALGAIAAVLTLLAAIGLCATSTLGGAAVEGISNELGGSGGLGIFGGLFGGLLMALTIVIYGGGLAITLFAAGEGIFLVLALEENTRATAEMLSKQKS